MSGSEETPRGQCPSKEELRRRVVNEAGEMVENNYHTKLSPKTQRRIEKFLLKWGPKLAALVRKTIRRDR